MLRKIISWFGTIRKDGYEKVPDLKESKSTPEEEIEDVDITVNLQWYKYTPLPASENSNSKTETTTKISDNQTALLNSHNRTTTLYIGVIILNGYSEWPGVTDLRWAIANKFSCSENKIKKSIKNPAFVSSREGIIDILKAKFSSCSVDSATVHLFKYRGKSEAELNKLIHTKKGKMRADNVIKLLYASEENTKWRQDKTSPNKPSKETFSIRRNKTLNPHR